MYSVKCLMVWNDPPPLPAWACLELWALLQAIYIATLTYINSVYIFILRLLYIYKSGTYIVWNYIYVWVERWLIQEQLMFVRAAILRTHIQPSKTFVFWNHFFLCFTIFYANLFLHNIYFMRILFAHTVSHIIIFLLLFVALFLKTSIRTMGRYESRIGL